MFRIVTLEREYASGGGGIAAELARRLGWKLWDQQLTCEIAKRAQVTESAVAQCDERVDSRLYRLAKAFWRGSYERSLPLDDSHVFDTDRMMAMMEEIMLGIAAEGDAVIVGRGSPFFLREREDTFRVFTYAPRDEKIRRLLAMGKGRRECEDLVENVDKERIAYIKHYFNAEWPVCALYHMMINTAIGDENVIAAILHGMQTLAANPADLGSAPSRIRRR
ncbi:MAG TPA: cytidylate kinase-like family protein [Candidatus Bathyarchaeia archaeon]|nr:cytidylate kinase-like family protein [Candidatus Bathyarchaeia archaeon]